MRPFTKNVVSAALAAFALSSVRSEDAPEIQSFVDYCAYRGVNFTGGHWLGGYCRNDMTAIFGNNYSWYVSCWNPVFISLPRVDRDSLRQDRSGLLRGQQWRPAYSLREVSPLSPLA
jgi:hypothetical protein